MVAEDLGEEEGHEVVSLERFDVVAPEGDRPKLQREVVCEGDCEVVAGARHR